MTDENKVMFASLAFLAIILACMALTSCALLGSKPAQQFVTSAHDLRMDVESIPGVVLAVDSVYPPAAGIRARRGLRTGPGRRGPLRDGHGYGTTYPYCWSQSVKVRNWFILAAAIIYNLSETAYFGWHRVPSCDAEVLADGISVLIGALAFLDVKPMSLVVNTVEATRVQQAETALDTGLAISEAKKRSRR